ncbi:MAG: transglutaminase-like domain-containing protein [Planctomycetaceae bacterium]
MTHIPSIGSRRLVLALLFLVMLIGTLCSHPAMTRAEDKATPSQAADNDFDDWQIIQMSGQKVGYAHATTKTETRDGQKIYITEIVTRLTVKRFGGQLISVVNQRTEEDADGRLLSFYLLQDNPPASKTESRGRVNGQVLTLETTSSGKSFSREIKLPDDLKSSVWFDRTLKENPMKVGETRSFKTFEPGLAKVTEVTIKQIEPGETKLLSGEIAKLQRAEMRQSILPLIVTTAYTDDAGEMLKTSIGLLGMETFSCTPEEALKEIESAQLDLGVDTIIKTGVIDRAFDSRKITYRLQPTDYDPTAVFPNSPTQQLRPTENGAFQLEVTAVDPGSEGTEPALEAKYLASSRFIDLDDDQIIKLADEMAGAETDPVKIAIAGEKFVHGHLKLKNFSSAMATASEVARSRSGDCTEHGILLAALLRAKKIPSRVVTGMVYATSLKGFGGHMWTEAYLKGRWVPLDATLANGHGDAVHLKTGDSALEDSSALPVESFLPLIHTIGRTKLTVEKVEY